MQWSITQPGESRAFATTWVDLKTIMLSEGSQTKTITV